MHPLKLVQIKNLFGILQTNPQIPREWVGNFDFQKNMFGWDTLLYNKHDTYGCVPAQRKCAGIAVERALSGVDDNTGIYLTKVGRMMYRNLVIMLTDDTPLPIMQFLGQLGLHRILSLVCPFVRSQDKVWITLENPQNTT